MVPCGDHNLRSRSRNNLEENVDENVGDDPEYQPEEDAMDDNEGIKKLSCAIYGNSNRASVIHAYAYFCFVQ